MSKMSRKLDLMLHDMNYPYSKPVDELFQFVIAHAVSTTIEFFHRIIVLDNGMSIDFWNENFPYGWLSHGVLKDNTHTVYSWTNKRPSRKTMIKLDELLQNIPGPETDQLYQVIYRQEKL